MAMSKREMLLARSRENEKHPIRDTKSESLTDELISQVQSGEITEEQFLELTGMQISSIPVESIDTDNLNEKLFGYEDIEKIEQSFDEIGNKSIIYVYKKTNGRYLCYAGNQRLIASKNEGKTSVVCVVSGNEPSEDEKLKNLIFMNAQRSDRAYYIAVRINEYEKMLRRTGFKGDIREELYSKLGYKKSQQALYKQILTLPEKLQALFKYKDMPFVKLLNVCAEINDNNIDSFVNEFEKARSSEKPITGELIDSILKKINHRDKTSAEQIDKPQKLSKIYNKVVGLVYSDNITIKDKDKETVRQQAEDLKLYLDKVIEACK